MITYEDIWASCIRMISDLNTDLFAQGVEVEYLEFDAHASIESFPDRKNILGPARFSLEDGGHSDYLISLGIGFGAYDDPNLFQHRKIAGVIHAKTRPTTAFDVLDAQTGERKAAMTILAPTTLLPMANSGVRSVQIFLVNLQTFDLAGSP